MDAWEAIEELIEALDLEDATVTLGLSRDLFEETAQ